MPSISSDSFGARLRILSGRPALRPALTACFVVLAAHPAVAKSQNPAAGIDRFMSTAAAYGQFSGAILVADDGRVVYERAFGPANMELNAPNRTTTRFEIASMTKSMTAIAIMQLVQEGRVRLDGKVSDYLPWYPSESGRQSGDPQAHCTVNSRSGNG